MAIRESGWAVQAAQHRVGHQPFRRKVEQVQRPGLHAPPGLITLLGVDVGVHPRGGDAGLFQRLHLVAHQGDQGRDHDRQARPHQGGDLVADALAAARGQHRQGAAPGQGLGDHIGLQPAEVGVTEHTAEDLAGVIEGGGGHAVLWQSDGDLDPALGSGVEDLSTHA